MIIQKNVGRVQWSRGRALVLRRGSGPARLQDGLVVEAGGGAKMAGGRVWRGFGRGASGNAPVWVPRLHRHLHFPAVDRGGAGERGRLVEEAPVLAQLVVHRLQQVAVPAGRRGGRRVSAAAWSETGCKCGPLRPAAVPALRAGGRAGRRRGVAEGRRGADHPPDAEVQRFLAQGDGGAERVSGGAAVLGHACSAGRREVSLPNLCGRCMAALQPALRDKLEGQTAARIGHLASSWRTPSHIHPTWRR